MLYRDLVIDALLGLGAVSAAVTFGLLFGFRHPAGGWGFAAVAVALVFTPPPVCRSQTPPC